MQVDDALAVLIAHARMVHDTQRYKIDDNGLPLEPNGDPAWDSSPAADLTREWCRKLLEASSADGHGGCPLCTS